MKALVTGATGLLGSHIVDKLLERGEEVRALARPTGDVSYLRERGAELAYGDVTDPNSLRAAAAGVDAVYHAAAVVSDWGKWSEFEAATIRGTENALRAAVEAGVPRFLHVSTDSVYPNRMRLRGAVYTEDTPPEKNPPSWDYYQRSKIAAEVKVWQFHREGSIRASAVRPALILGERDRSIMPEFVRFLRGPGAVYIGPGYNRHPCVYAGDVAELCILAATEEAGAGQAYNAASLEIITQRDLFAAVAAEVGLQPPKRSVAYRLVYLIGAVNEMWARLLRSRKRPTMTRAGANLVAGDYVLDVAKAKRELGWEAKVSMREAVRRSVDWIKARQSFDKAQDRPQSTGG